MSAKAVQSNRLLFQYMAALYIALGVLKKDKGCCCLMEASKGENERDPVNNLDPTGLMDDAGEGGYTPDKDKNKKDTYVDPVEQRYGKYGRTSDKDEKLREQRIENEYFKHRESYEKKGLDLEKFKEKMQGFREKYGNIAQDVFIEYLSLSDDQDIIDLEFDKIVDRISDVLQNNDKLRREILVNISMDYLNENLTATEVDLLGYMYAADIFIFKGNNSELTQFQQAMIALDVAVILNFNSNEAVTRVSSQFRNLINLSNLTKEEKQRLLASLDDAIKNAHNINLRGRIVDTAHLRAINGGGWSQKFLDSINPLANNSHHFAAFVLAGVLIGDLIVRGVSVISELPIINNQGLRFNPGDNNLGQLAVTAASSESFWIDPEGWLGIWAK